MVEMKLLDQPSVSSVPSEVYMSDIAFGPALKSKVPTKVVQWLSRFRNNNDLVTRKAEVAIE